MLYVDEAKEPEHFLLIISPLARHSKEAGVRHKYLQEDPLDDWTEGPAGRQGHSGRVENECQANAAETCSQTVLF